MVLKTPKFLWNYYECRTMPESPTLCGFRFPAETTGAAETHLPGQRKSIASVATTNPPPKPASTCRPL